MKKSILLAFLFCTSFQLQGMETVKDQDTQSVRTNYGSAVRQLSQITQAQMTALQVNGRDYSEWVLPQINKVRALAYSCETNLQFALRQSIEAINNAYANTPKVLIIDDGETTQGPKTSSTPLGRSSRKIEEEKAQKIEKLRSQCSEASQLISNFYDAPAECLDTRNDIYVYLYFDLRNLKDALASPLNETKSSFILAHFQGVKDCLVNLKESLRSARQENKLAFQKNKQTFEEIIEVVGTPYLFQYTLSAELLTDKLINDMGPVVDSIMAAGQAIEYSLAATKPK